MQAEHEQVIKTFMGLQRTQGWQVVNEYVCISVYVHIYIYIYTCGLSRLIIISRPKITRFCKVMKKPLRIYGRGGLGWFLREKTVLFWVA